MAEKTLVLFDFDGTLVRGDSLFPFLHRVAGKKAFLFSWGRALIESLSQPFGQRRTYIKAKMLKDLLSGRPLESLQPAIEDLRDWPIWKRKIQMSLREHHAQGHHIVIASGSLDVYLPALLADNVPYNGLICTQMEVVDGKLTGVMASGNCARERKAELVKAYIDANGPFYDSWGYGNSPHDIPMLKLVKHQVLV